MLAAAVGPITAKPLQAKGIEPIVPDRGRLGALVRALVGHYEQAQTAAVTTAVGRLQVRRTVALLDDHVLPVSPSGLEVLRLLASRGGDVVSRAEVLAVLPGESTDPHAAEVAIARLREVCGRSLVQTVVKRGYRLATA
jgi:uroporphyrinogen-III synthase